MPSIDRGRRRDAGHADAWAARGVRRRYVRRDGCEPPRRAVIPVIVRHLGAGVSPHPCARKLPVPSLSLTNVLSEFWDGPRLESNDFESNDRGGSAPLSNRERHAS